MANPKVMANPINNFFANVLSGGTRTKPYTRLAAKIKPKTVEDIIAYATIGSVVAKDTVGCAMYVTQSLNNEKIPEKRRKFVAALDLTNGGLMVASQLILFFAMRKINDKLFYKLFKSFGKDGKLFGGYAERLRADAKKVGAEVKSKSKLRADYAGMKHLAISLFRSVTELVAATILAKRIIVPFIATPLASKVEKYMDKKGVGGSDNGQAATAAESFKGSQQADKVATQPDAMSQTSEKGEVTNLLELARMNKKQ